MKSRFLFVAFLLLSGAIHGAEPLPADPASVRRTIEDYYAAYSVRDAVKYRGLVTDDYMLIEQGDLLGLKEDIATFAKPDMAKQERTDTFDFHSILVDGLTAVAVYTLKSDIRTNTEVKHRIWRESAVLRQSERGWKVYLLHSTKIELAK